LSTIQAEYLKRIEALSVKERVARSAAMFQWSREIIARQILAESGELPPEELKWQVALRQYGSDTQARALIARMLTH
jgi:hypothetical protein